MSRSQLRPGKSRNDGALAVHFTNAGRIFILLALLSSLMAGSATSVSAATAVTFTAEELLGRPEDTSITINIVPAATIEYHYQYGISSNSYISQTANFTAIGGQPHEIVISGLAPNTKYFYRMQYHAPGDGMNDWVNRTERTFRTQRARGSTFVFTITADSHAAFNTVLQQAMTNIYNDRPDFHIDLGDTFSLDDANSQSDVNSKYLAYREPLYFDRIGHSIPIFLASGNHENEEGWNLDDKPFSIALASIQGRKAYYPTPIQDGFYSGNTDPLSAINAGVYGDQYREDYYAWAWGDALFVVIDPYQYTMNLPYPPTTVGEGRDDRMTGDQWSWTLGARQSAWLRRTLQNSDARYKFIFSHHPTGGVPDRYGTGWAGYVRGGAEAAGYFEWGGNNTDGTWGFSARRNPADFGPKPIHQFMVEYGVSAYFHGHDHTFAYERRDGIVYQEVPTPNTSGSGFSSAYAEGDHGAYQTIKVLPNSGHLRVTVAPDRVTVDYVRSDQTGVSYTYTITPRATQ